MKKFFAIALALVMALAMVACAKPADAPAYFPLKIDIYGKKYLFF